jgi:undecaprenyl-diphosphatase
MTSILLADAWFENFMLSIRTPFGVHLFSVVTFFGNSLTIIGIAGLIGAYMVFSREEYKPYLIGLVVTLSGAAASAYALKEIVQRARPSGLIPAVTETSFSFPSGHAVASVALYGFIAFLLSRLYPRHKRVAAALAALVALTISFSRLYLGVHYPSDVIAGFILGGLWLWIGIWVTNRFRSRREIVVESITEVTITEIT